MSELAAEVTVHRNHLVLNLLVDKSIDGVAATTLDPGNTRWLIKASMVLQRQL